MTSNKRRAGFVALSCVAVFSMINSIMYLFLAAITGMDFLWFAGGLFFLAAASALLLGWRRNLEKTRPSYVGEFVIGVALTTLALLVIFSIGFSLLGGLCLLFGLYNLYRSRRSYKKSRITP